MSKIKSIAPYIILLSVFLPFQLNASIIPDRDSVIVQHQNEMIPDSAAKPEATKDIPISEFWKLGGNGSVNFSQGYLKNWAEGGESSISTLTVLTLYSNYKKKKTHWDNSLNLKYGLLKSGEKDLRKNEDKLEINSKYGQKAFKTFYYSLMINVKTQIARGYEYPNDSAVWVSDFFAPAEALMAVGMDYKPNDKLSILLSPITSKSTFVLIEELDETKYGLEEGKFNKYEVGAYLKTLFKWDITDEILIQNRLDFFTNYLNKPENLDVNWEVGIAMKVNKYINTNINTHLMYDDDIRFPVEYTALNPETGLMETKTKKSPKIQFKEVLSVGLSYKF